MIAKISLIFAILVLFAAPAITQGAQSCGLQFNGASLITVPYSPGFQAPDFFTLEAWLEPDGASGIVARSQGVWTLRHQNGSFRFDSAIGGSSGTLLTPASYPIGSYYHVAITYSATTGRLKFYVDGSMVASDTFTPGSLFQQNSNDLLIGNGQNGNNPYSGKIDELRVWSVERSNASLIATRDFALRSAAGLEFVLAADGPASGASAATPFVDATGVHTGSISGNLTYQGGVVCAVSHPGSGADFRQRTSVRNDPVDLVGDKSLSFGEPVDFAFDSPGGAHSNDPFYWVIQVTPAGVAPTTNPGIPGLLIDLNQPYLFILENFPLPPGGFGASATGPQLTDADIWSQAAVLSPSLALGYATSDAHVFSTPNSLRVDATALPGGNGSAANPFNRIADAVQAAVPGDHLLIATGTYNESFTVSTPVSMTGGYDSSNWTPTSQSSTVFSNQRGIKFESIDRTTNIRSLVFRSADGVAPSGNSGLNRNMSSIALDVRNSTSDLRFENCRFEPGNGVDGPDGASNPSTPAASGNNGGNGQNGQFSASFPQSRRSGGNGAQNGGDGGGGGNAVCTNMVLNTCTSINRRDGQGGDDGSGTAGGNGGNGGNQGGTAGVAQSGSHGDNGQRGVDGQNGAASAGVAGRVDSSDNWTPAVGTQATDGTVGGGGGGGGGGGCIGSTSTGVALGGGGGGGGGGGRLGLAGENGYGGGCSFGAWLVNSSPTFSQCNFQVGDAGNGGNGGNGRRGGAGGSGGDGGTGWGGAPGGIGVQSGSGGDGGNGGRGGDGGGGSSGNGGSSVGVALIGNSAPPMLMSNSFSLGQAGVAGMAGIGGGSLGQAGAGLNGSSVTTFSF